MTAVSPGRKRGLETTSVEMPSRKLGGNKTISFHC